MYKKPPTHPLVKRHRPPYPLRQRTQGEHKVIYGGTYSEHDAHPPNSPIQRKVYNPVTLAYQKTGS